MDPETVIDRWEMEVTRPLRKGKLALAHANMDELVLDLIVAFVNNRHSPPLLRESGREVLRLRADTRPLINYKGGSYGKDRPELRPGRRDVPSPSDSGFRIPDRLSNAGLREGEGETVRAEGLSEAIILEYVQGLRSEWPYTFGMPADRAEDEAGS